MIEKGIKVGYVHVYDADFLAAGGSKVRYVDWQEEEPTPMYPNNACE